MNEFQTILYEVDRGRARITLNRPEKLNALSMELQRELNEALWEADNDSRVHAVILRANGRAFSAGCVRVQDVFTLVEWIAKYETGWDQPGRTQDILAAGQAIDMNLTRPVPVYFTYVTAWAELDGRVVFRPDIYGRDGVRDLNGVAERDPGDPPPTRFTLAP